MNVHDTEARLKATIVSRSGDSGPWSLVPDGWFEGFPVKECPCLLYTSDAADE